MHKIIVRIAMFRRGVERFEADVNALLAKGWAIRDWSVEKRGLRIGCKALFHHQGLDETRR